LLWNFGVVAVTLKADGGGKPAERFGREVAVPDYLRESPVYESPLVSVADLRCRPLDGGCGGEEYASWPSIAFVRAGAFCKHVGADEILADANHLVFFNADEPYRVSHPVHGGDDCTSLRFDCDSFAEAVAAFDASAMDHPDRPFRISHGLSSARSVVLLHRVRAAAVAMPAVDAMRVDEACCELLHEVTAAAFAQIGRRECAAGPAARRAHRQLVSRTRLLLAARFTEPLLLADIAEAVGASPYHLVRVFRREVGIPVHRYVARLRLRSALARLAEGQTDLTKLALDLGFSSHSHFTDSFRQEFGLAPSQFRKLLGRHSPRGSRGS
jgi:AraC-like DNA-binding protein